jgi:hypothetical protein
MVKKQIPLSSKWKWIMYNMNLVIASWSAAIIFSSIAITTGMKGVEASQKYFVGYPPQGIQVKTK